VTYHDAVIQVALDGKTYIDIQDSHLAGAGKVEVWTKADSITLFDNFIYIDAARNWRSASFLTLVGRSSANTPRCANPKKE
jgi:hypothetical protein